MSANPTSILSTAHEVYPPSPKVDRRTVAVLGFPQDITATITCDLSMPLSLGFVPSLPQIFIKVEAEKGILEMLNFIIPTMYHSITVTPRQGDATIKKRVVKAYRFVDAGMKDKGDKPWWSTYRYQLEAFVDRVKGRTPQTWVEKDDSIANMEWIERVYEKVCLLVHLFVKIANNCIDWTRESTRVNVYIFLNPSIRYISCAISSCLLCAFTLQSDCRDVWLAIIVLIRDIVYA